MIRIFSVLGVCEREAAAAAAEREATTAHLSVHDLRDIISPFLQPMNKREEKRTQSE